jgi:hypothetical protein
VSVHQLFIGFRKAYENLIDASNEISLEVKAETTKYIQS